MFKKDVIYGMKYFDNVENVGGGGVDADIMKHNIRNFTREKVNSGQNYTLFINIFPSFYARRALLPVPEIPGFYGPHVTGYA